MALGSTYGTSERRPEFDPTEFEGVDPNPSFELPHASLSSASVRTATWSLDRSTDVVRWSEPLDTFFGFAEGMRGYSVQVLDGDDARTPSSLEFDDLGAFGRALIAPVLDLDEEASVPSTSVQLLVRCPDGIVHEVTISRAGGLSDTDTVVLGVLVEVTAESRMEQELDNLADRYRLLTEMSPDIVVVHQNGLIVYANRAAVRVVFEVESDEDYLDVMQQSLGRSIVDFVHPDDIMGMIERIGHLTEEGQFTHSGEARLVTVSGKSILMEVTSVRTSWAGEPAYQVIMRDISERHAAEAANSYRASLVANVSDAIIGIDADGVIESWNEAASTIYGWSEDDVVGRSLSALLTGDVTDGAEALTRGVRFHRKKDGGDVCVQLSIDPLIGENGLPKGWVVVCTEMTDARRAEAGRRAAEERYEAVVASLSEGVVVINADGQICASNEAARRILGHRLDSFHGHQAFAGPSIGIDGEGIPLSESDYPHVRTLRTGVAEDGIIIGVTDTFGHRQWLSMSARLLARDELQSDEESGRMVVCSFTDVTDQRVADAQLQWLAFHDSLTGLGNRTKFNDELERELNLSVQRGTNLAVLFIDLDRFNLVNDSFGHAAGDEVLITLAQRFKAAVRGGDVISRFSGDEFVVLCRNVQDVKVAASLAHEYMRLLAEPVPLSTGRTVKLSCSVGISFVMRGRVSAEEILQQADLAMFQAKSKGRARVEIFDESLRAKSVARLEIYDDLRYSIEHDEMTVHYQPIASVADDHIVALEALVRWNHPLRGLLGPMEFIPYAEETDLIFSLGRWVLREACATMAHWRKTLPGAEKAYVTVNLSVHQLADETLLDTIAAALHDSGLPPDGLVMEVTESMLMSDTSASIELMSGIHSMGVGLAIDDFGTGYSSLSQLKRFPVKVLKIDKTFVDGLGTFENDEAIVAAIVQLSKALGLTVLAEGVETQIQLDRVADLGCDLYQGYLMSRPVDASAVLFDGRRQRLHD